MGVCTVGVALVVPVVEDDPLEPLVRLAPPRAVEPALPHQERHPPGERRPGRGDHVGVAVLDREAHVLAARHPLRQQGCVIALGQRHRLLAHPHAVVADEHGGDVDGRRVAMPEARRVEEAVVDVVDGLDGEVRLRRDALGGDLGAEADEVATAGVDAEQVLTMVKDGRCGGGVVGPEVITYCFP